jgi:hypothetical protein
MGASRIQRLDRFIVLRRTRPRKFSRVRPFLNLGPALRAGVWSGFA